jgi:glycosyltransferase involved in cell wall biosynthesis
VTVLIVTDAFYPAVAAGGPVRSLEALVKAMPETEFMVLTRDCDLGSAQKFQVSERFSQHNVEVRYLDVTNILGILRMLRALYKAEAEVVYLNSFFSPLFSIVPLLLLRSGVAKPQRLVLAPRGELSSGALSLKAAKKKLYIAFFRRFLATRVDVFHATSESESHAIKTMKFSRPISTISNLALQLPPGPGTRSANFLLFVGRISPKKNLLLTLQAMACIRMPITFVVAGPVDDRAYYNQCKRVADDAEGYLAVKWLGTVRREDLPQLYMAARSLVHPSLDENFGHSIAEALSLGCPVIIGPSTPWSSNVDGRCGWIVDPQSMSEIRDALVASLQAGPSLMKQLSAEALRVRSEAVDHTAIPAYARLLSSAPYSV